MNKVTAEIRRPNGEVETVDISDKFQNMNDSLFANLKKQVKAAGRGELLTYKVEYDREISEEQKEYERKARFFARHACDAK
jgi:hypothetical protein